MEPTTARMVVTAAILAGLVGALIGWQAAESNGPTTEVLRARGYVDLDGGGFLHVDTNGDGNADRGFAGLSAAEWWDGEVWHGPDDRLPDCLPDFLPRPDELEPVEAGVVDIPAFGDGAGRPYVIWLKCPGTF